MNKTAVYPGSFDPVTNGHIDIINRASKMYDKLVVAVLVNKKKESLFTVEERLEFIKKSVEHLKNVEVDSFSGLLVDYCLKKDITIAIRGLRALSDFEMELQMAHINDFLSKGKVDTVFLATSTQHSYISSSAIREIAMFKGDYNNLVPEQVRIALKNKFL